MRYLFIIILLLLQSCSTYMQNRIGEEFKSIQPDYTNFETVDISTAGAVYAGGGGLFASDRRANAVGDIITITLEESMTAANSGSETTSKQDSYFSRKVLKKIDYKEVPHNLLLAQVQLHKQIVLVVQYPLQLSEFFLTETYKLKVKENYLIIVGQNILDLQE